MSTPTREDYELAAKAASLNLLIPRGFDQKFGDLPLLLPYRITWNPYHDDGDSRRLQVAIRADLYLWDDAAESTNLSGFEKVERYTDHNGDEGAAARAAVFKLAVEIGRTK